MSDLIDRREAIDALDAVCDRVGMIDREKVIKGLECILSEFVTFEDECIQKGCPYAHFDDCDDLVIRDAIALLREEEAVTPQSFDEWHKIERNYMELRVWRCGYCTTSLDVTDNFCRNCGKKVDWK